MLNKIFLILTNFGLQFLGIPCPGRFSKTKFQVLTLKKLKVYEIIAF